MPTTCGFPNCKFRSRYKGQEDNRHFYRIPKRPPQLRQLWLNAIGRTEETVVSQLRICSAHFYGGEKKEGDIPVPDPQFDPPVFINLPPRNESIRYNSKTSKSNEHVQRLATKRNKILPKSSINLSKKLNAEINSGVSSITNNFFSNNATETTNNSILSSSNSLQQSSSLIQSSNSMQPSTSTQLTNSKPLVALLDGRDCSIEMPLLKDVATVAFCDAQMTSEIHDKVLNEAIGAFLYQSIVLSKEDLLKFKALKILVRVGSGYHNIDVDAATELGIAVCNVPGDCVEETADSTMLLILNMYRKTFWIARAAQQFSKELNYFENLRDLVEGRRIRGSTLGIIGLGRVGTAVAVRAKSFGFNIIFYDPYAPNGCDRALGIERCDNLINLLARSDCVTLHCPLNSQTVNLIDAECIQKMKFGAFLVNTCALALVNATALLNALKSGQIKAVAMDVFERECYNGTFSDGMTAALLAQLPNVISTPNCAWYSDDSLKEMRTAAAKEIRRVLIGRFPLDLINCINKDALILKLNENLWMKMCNLNNFAINPLAENSNLTKSILMGSNMSNIINQQKILSMNKKLQEEVEKVGKINLGESNNPLTLLFNKSLENEGKANTQEGGSNMETIMEHWNNFASQFATGNYSSTTEAASYSPAINPLALMSLNPQFFFGVNNIPQTLASTTSLNEGNTSCTTLKGVNNAANFAGIESGRSSTISQNSSGDKVYGNMHNESLLKMVSSQMNHHEINSNELQNRSSPKAMSSFQYDESDCMDLNETEKKPSNLTEHHNLTNAVLNGSNNQKSSVENSLHVESN